MLWRRITRLPLLVISSGDVFPNERWYSRSAPTSLGKLRKWHAILRRLFFSLRPSAKYVLDDLMLRPCLLDSFFFACCCMFMPRHGVFNAGVVEKFNQQSQRPRVFRNLEHDYIVSVFHGFGINNHHTNKRHLKYLALLEMQPRRND